MFIFNSLRMLENRLFNSVFLNVCSVFFIYTHFGISILIMGNLHNRLLAKVFHKPSLPALSPIWSEEQMIWFSSFLEGEQARRQVKYSATCLPKCELNSSASKGTLKKRMRASLFGKACMSLKNRHFPAQILKFVFIEIY